MSIDLSLSKGQEMLDASPDAGTINSRGLGSGPLPTMKDGLTLF